MVTFNVSFSCHQVLKFHISTVCVYVCVYLCEIDEGGGREGKKERKRERAKGMFCVHSTCMLIGGVNCSSIHSST